MDKIGLVSVRNYNYGSILQAYALQQELFAAGVDNEIIYYRKRNIFKQIMRIFNLPLLIAKTKDIRKFLESKTNPKLKPVMKGRNEAFRKFVEERIIFSPQLAGRRKLIEYSKHYSAFVLGSDQVWNPMLLGGDYFTLTWVADHIPKVSYASSFGVSEIPANQRKKTSEYLSRFCKISVREQSGAKIVKKLIGRTATVCCDPTVLIDRSRWDDLSGDEAMISVPYIFCYFIGDNPAQREFAEKLASMTECKILAIKHIDEYIKSDDCFGDIEYLHAGPGEFVNFVRHAKYVCTDSFHGTIFSILYHKQFYTFKRFTDGQSNSMNSRVKNILHMTGLDNRLFENNTRPEVVYNLTVDWENVQIKLEAFRANSQNYFQSIVDYMKG